MSINEDLADLLIGHRLQVLRYEAGLAEDLLTAYSAALGDLRRDVDRLRARADAATTDREREKVVEALRRLNDRAREIHRRVRDLEATAGLTLEQRLEEAAKAEQRFQSVRVARTVHLSWNAPPDVAVAQALRGPIGGDTPRNVLRRDLLEAAEGLQATIARAVAQGASMDRAARYLREAGILDEHYRGRLVAVARTEIQRVANTVALDTYAANADVLDAVEWLATLDSRTCLLCAPLHGKIFQLGADGRPMGLPSIPRHPRCRCFTAPVVKGYADLGLKVSKDFREFDGKPSGGPTFEQWLRKQSAADQREVLGSTRYELWKAGTPLARFSDARRVLRLGELAALA